ncbi:DegT/DnrJ/EryC1/StrS family aminotransferase [Cytophagaceae bacterium DM2B3-1]|uniref:DegT/DnrJ/EryC1/StrS family aminotransferase n=1 Tax=Xanthocytophaga flava TaxID=3048013 RepID=A0ABT7CJ03_9BACT|nr:DegT/DnrJ/EryC1/StrS family aminotransferase [Xanthocytophaga flavus]MDJ1492669.1 DegT/DnrJ/EryC1/StrS family aminotransferase [Xanthocytophaga flavus]
MPGIEFFGEEERREVMDVLETGVMFRYNHDAERKGHWKARDFEKSVADFVGAKYAHAVSNGSAAVVCALAACGVGYNDEVIVPPFTFIATVEAVLWLGAIPVFAEIDETLNLSPEGIKACITPKTKAVLLVQMCGAMAKMDEIVKVCQDNNVMLIEDTAQALGASYKGKSAGLWGRMGCYSFDFFKITTCGEGGVLVTNDEQLYKNADVFSDHGHDHIGNNRGMEKHPALGINFRIGEFNAAVGLAQMRKIKQFIEIQRKNKATLVNTLSKFPFIQFREMTDEAGDSATFLSFFMPDEAAARLAVEEFKAQSLDSYAYWFDNNYHYIKNWDHLISLTSVNPMPIHHQEKPQDWSKIRSYIPKTDNLISRLISLQVKVGWTDEQLTERCQKLSNAFEAVAKKLSVTA